MNLKPISTLIIGENPDFLLFKVAINVAKLGKKVWFVSTKPFESIPEGLEHPPKDILQLITFFYLNTFEALIKHLNGIHKWSHLPSMIIIKNFDSYCKSLEGSCDSRQAAYLMANLLNATYYLSKKELNNYCVKLVASCCQNAFNSTETKVLLDMYFDNCTFFQPNKIEELIENVTKGTMKNV